MPRAGFESILDAIEAKVRARTSLREAMEEILTLGRRFALEFGAQSLTPEQAAVFESSARLRFEPCSDASELHDTAEAWFFGVWSYGRIWLAPAPPRDAECRLLGSFRLTPAQADAVAARAAQIRREWSRCDEEMDRFYAGLDAAGLQTALYEVHESVDHTDPVLLYVGETTLTNIGKLNNLQERNSADLPDCFFRRAQTMTIEQWTRDERIFVFCIYSLRKAGCRGEEFNGRQLNPALVGAYLDERLLEYSAWMPHLLQTWPDTIAEKAALLARCKAGGACDLLTYRWVNGLNFYKEERLYPREHLRLGVTALHEGWTHHLTHAWGLHASRHESLAALFDACIARMAEHRFVSDDPELNAVERMLKTIVDCAIDATGSDVGMTRGFRDLSVWQQAFREHRYDAACAWPTTDYYCGVFPSRAFEARFQETPEHLFRILYACSGRMQFNSWHYMPGHCPRDSVPSSRHFYLPPRMPDTAIWSDQHHAGHMLAEVRYSIRSPAPIEFDGHVYGGMVDLRLFRQRGEPYRDDELFVAMSFSDVVRAFCQSLSDHLVRGGVPLRITAFDKEWFKRYYARPRAMPHATPEPLDSMVLHASEQLTGFGSGAMQLQQAAAAPMTP